MTIIEKIFSRKTGGKKVKPGDYIWVDLSLVAMRDFGGPNVIQEYIRAFGDHPVFDKKRVAVTFDLHIPARNEKVAVNQKTLRDFVKQQGVHLFDVNTGIGQHILLENGLVKPWDIVIGTDSHMNLLGAVGAAGFGMGTTDVAGAMYKGRLWFRVPETIKIVVKGNAGEYVTAKDIILYILKRLKTDGALNRAVEFTGDAVERMTLAERITMSSMVTEMSGEVGFFETSAEVLDFIRSRTDEPISGLKADPDAGYEKAYEFVIDDLKPQIACPHSPDNVTEVEKKSGVKVNQVFIGSCTNGRFEDLKAAADILKGRRINKGVRLIIVPATAEVAAQAVEAGLYESFLKSGAVVTNPGCALCTTGHPGILAPGEVMVSTSNRNFIGKLGKGAEVYLASPVTAAATALTGVITPPGEI
ncbi:MAG TPA: homoaconitate hydratase family protein [candidate division WOR-3 bacterium]|uniref:Homoaconitate hydratase family protein n=1 Tax=candidate division WOR-3 bacterium TaxID=2052148 RepID=A0A9C9ELN8_UNCW3|nr:homoaconitate hydratase family protein [candidate division WOR-3 bacterium]